MIYYKLIWNCDKKENEVCPQVVFLIGSEYQLNEEISHKEHTDPKLLLQKTMLLIKRNIFECIDRNYKNQPR